MRSAHEDRFQGSDLVEVNAWFVLSGLRILPEGSITEGIDYGSAQACSTRDASRLHTTKFP